MKGLKALVLLLFILAAVVCVSKAQNEIDGRDVVQASEILAKIERGELANYTQKTIEGDINLTHLKLSESIRINRTPDETKYHGLLQEQQVVRSPIFIEDCIITGSVDFSNTCFREPVVIFNSSILEDADFSGSRFSLILIVFSKFNLSADFSYSQFMDYAHFDYSKFKEHSRFRRSKFDQYVFFNESQFDKEVDFSGSQFDLPVDFSGFHFNQSVDFGGSDFSQSVDFSWTHFNQSVDFGADFNQSVDFENAQFNDDADFSGSQFNQSANFEDAQFNQRADFTSSQFNGDANFNSCQFNKYAPFYLSIFYGNITFRNSIFNRDADFWASQFKKSADFSGSKFNQSADFSGCKFNENVDFSYCEFGEDADFYGTQFKENANFESARFSGGLTFENSTLSRLNLKKAEISEIKLNSWESIDHMEYDEMAYQYLLSNLRNKNLPDEANECYYDYRDGRRATLNLLYQPVDYGLMLFYGYGVKPERPVIWAFVFMALFAALFWWRQGILPIHEGEPEEEAARFTLLEAAAFSAMTFLSGGKLVFDPPEYRIAPGKPWRNVQICEVLFACERLIGMMLIIMFGVAVTKTIILS